MISKSLGVVCTVESMRHPWKQLHWWFLMPQGLFAMSNPWVTPGSSLVDDFLPIMGSLRCRIHASYVEAVSLMISESLRGVCTVESRRHPWEQFVDDFWVPKVVCVVQSMRHTWEQLVNYLWVSRCCFGCRIHASPVEVLLLMIFESLGAATAICAVESMGYRGSNLVDYF